MIVVYIIASIYSLIFIGNSSELSHIEILTNAWNEPIYNETFNMAIKIICFNLTIILLIFIFLNRRVNSDIFMAVFSWLFAIVAWVLTPGLIEFYILGAISVSFIVADNVKHINRAPIE